MGPKEVLVQGKFQPKGSFGPKEASQGRFLPKRGVIYIIYIFLEKHSVELFFSNGQFAHLQKEFDKNNTLTLYEQSDLTNELGFTRRDI